MQKFENITKINFLKESRELQQSFNKYSDLKEKSAKIIIGLQGHTDNKSLKNLTITENNFCEKINCLFTILSKYLGVNSIKIQEEIVELFYSYYGEINNEQDYNSLKNTLNREIADFIVFIAGNVKELKINLKMMEIIKNRTK